ncbi:MAG TPA: hypothetical protein VD931_00060 [Baekduia sp.]|nr:hypothetical protein [Baekduia sp.]
MVTDDDRSTDSLGDDPLAALAAELERLGEATLELGALTEELARHAGPAGPRLRDAAAASRRAARAVTAASANVRA